MNKGVWVVFPLLVGSVVAQLNTIPLIRRVRVRVLFADGSCDISTHVKLQGARGPVAEASPDSECEVDFSNVPEGNYDLKVSGQNFVATNSVVMSTGASNDFEIKVTRAGEAARPKDASLLPIVAITDMTVPA